ncbi:MAG: deoxyribose-phosphate aldolase [Brevinema sp.]
MTSSISKKIDHTLLKATASIEDIQKLCQEALDYKFATVCVNPMYIGTAEKILKNSQVSICTVIGFPLGASRTAVKVAEAMDAINAGASEIDMVVAIGFIKSKKFDLVRYDIEQLCFACHSKGIILKVILETCYLTKDELKKVIEICIDLEADFIKTSTGFGSQGATVEDISFMKSLVGDKIKIKASGGIRTFEDAQKMLQAGADRLGTSNSVAIVQKITGSNQY